MSDIRLMFPSEYVAAPDLKGKDVVLTITRVSQETIKTSGGDEMKPLIYFEETAAAAKKTGTKEKRLVLNKTNMNSIADMYGYEADEWVGKKITVYPTTCSAFGDTVDCVRIRKGVPK